MISRYELLELLQRPLFFFRLRNIYLRLLGAKIGKNVKIIRTDFIMPFFNNLTIGDNAVIQRSSLIDLSDKISIGIKSTLSCGVYLITHRTTGKYNKRLPSKKAPIEIGNHVFIGARAIILSGVKIRDHSIIGAGALVNKDVPPNSLAVGVPIKIKKIKKHKEMI